MPLAPPQAPPSQDRQRALRWILPLLVIVPVLQLWRQSNEKEQAATALAQIGRDDDPTAFLRKSPEQLLCSGDAPALCELLEIWKKATDCNAKRTVLADLKTALADYRSSPSFMKLAGGVVNVETATMACKDD